ncbi:MAG: YcaO-like family protein [Proteobacteria bacterium]|nr:YcaO-like family protein [Pseudomonadota bacterium]MBU1738125.1 YcaO-like family protein [Pseudomonadota bacterium]
MQHKKIVLQDCLKTYTYDQDKAMTPEETVNRFEAKLKKVNLDILREIRRIDNGRLDIPVYFSVCGKDAFETIGNKKQMGKGSTPEQSRASACMELGERFSFFSFKKNPANFIVDTYDNLKRAGQSVLPVAKLLQSVHDEKTTPALLEKLLEGLTMQWVWATNITTNAEVLVPFSWFYAINEFNGPSAGNTYEEAISQGVCEIVERHVCSIISRGRLKTPAIDPASVKDPVARELLDKFNRHGIKVYLNDFSLDTGIPTVGALAYDPSTFPTDSEIVYTAGTTPNPEKSLIRALTEVAQLAGDFNTKANYVASGLEKPLSMEEARYITEVEKTITINEMADLTDDNMKVEIERCLGALRKLDMEALIVNTMHPDLQIPTIYTIVPGAHFRERSMVSNAGLFAAKLVNELIADPEEKVRQFARMEELLPDAYFIEFYLGQNLYEQGRPDEALPHLRRALVLDPDREDIPYIYSYMGNCLKDLEQYADAIETLKRGTEHDDERPDLHNLLGFCYFKLADHEAAIEHFSKAVYLAPTSAIDYANLGVNYRKLGRKDEALKSFALALSLDPSITFAKEHMRELSAES